MCSDRLRLTGRMTSYPPLYIFVCIIGASGKTAIATLVFQFPFVRLFKCYLLLYYILCFYCMGIENKSMSMSMSMSMYV